MKICIDCRLIDSGGLGTFLRGILAHLLDRSGDGGATTYLLVGDTARLAPYASAGAELLHCTLPIFSEAEQLRYPYREVNRCDAYLSPAFNLPLGIRIPVYTVVHDVLYMDMPHLTSRAGYLLRRFYLAMALRQSRHVFTVSHFSRSRILAHFPRVRSLSVCYNGLDETFARPMDSTSPLPAWATSAPYYLYVGNLKPHKGIDTLARAASMLPEGHRIIIAGSGDNFRSGLDVDTSEAIERGTASGRIYLPGHIPASMLPSLYARATALVQPSVYEGFGIPPLEAMSMGTPAVVSDIEVFREVYSGFPVTYFRAGDPRSLVTALLATTGRIDLSPALRERYSYRSTARHILERITGRADILTNER